MRLLIDTNIFIYREDPKIISTELQELLKLLQEEQYKIMVHPASIEDIQKDSNNERMNIMLSKLKTYPTLETPPDFSKDLDFILKIPNYENLTSNDIIDLKLFYAIYKNAVSYLITEDKNIHKWANIFGMESCYNIINALEFFKGLVGESEEVFKPIPIKYLPLHNLKLEDPFFNSLKEDYGKDSFEKWFKKKAKEGNKAYVYFNDNGLLGAFLMLKKENESIGSKPFILPAKNRIKICTLKVSNIGNKIGELFIDISFKHAMESKYDELYLTHYVKEDDYFVYLIEQYGFVLSKSYITREHTEKKEAIFIKNIKTDTLVDKDKLRTLYFPSFYDGTENRKFIVPIKPLWHNRLFPNLRVQTNLLEYTGKFYIEGNTIQKAYLSHTNCQQMKKGDILIFYKSEQNQGITAFGTIDDVFYSVDNSEDVVKLVGKRTVYNLDEIEEMINKKPLTIILFKYHFKLPEQLTTEKLKEKKIIKSAPQSIMELNQSTYLRLKRETKIPHEFTQGD